MQTVLITGASSGFGKAGAQAFARNGDTVVAAVRNRNAGEAMQRDFADEGLSIELVELDVTKPESFAPVIKEINVRFGGIDVLVNNAGILRPGALEDLQEQELRLVVETNTIAPLLLSKAVLPYMRERQSGLIIMVSSLSGIAGLPGDVAYTASKFALEGASEALRHEVDRWGIRVALIEAGMYKTRIFPDRGGSLLPEGYPYDSPYRPLVEAKLREVYSRLPDAFDPAIVGELMVKIASSTSNQFRWPADPVAEKVVATVFAHDDESRDTFLRDVSGTDWWSDGDDRPVAGADE